MPTVIVKNNTIGNVTISDLGVIIPASSQDTLSDNLNIREIRESVDLRSLEGLGTLTLNDGIGDIADVNAFLGPQEEFHGGAHDGDGADPVPEVTTLVSGIMSAVDKTK